MDPPVPIDQHLLPQYTHNSVFSEKIREINGVYKAMCPILGDGNCFYRALLCAAAIQFPKRALESVARNKQLITIDPICWEDFVEELEVFLNSAESAQEKLSLVLEKLPEVEKPAVVFLRMITAQYLRNNVEQFEPAVLGLGTASLEDFVRSEVEPLDKEADFPQCLALASALGFTIRVEYLDNNPGNIRHLDFPELPDSTPDVFLLYRPGHYDLLLPK
jgi:ubiquitin thioesterase protein OTUB1